MKGSASQKPAIESITLISQQFRPLRCGFLECKPNRPALIVIVVFLCCAALPLCVCAEGCSSLSNRNLPPSFWNSNYIHPVVAPSHPQVSVVFVFLCVRVLCCLPHWQLGICANITNGACPYRSSHFLFCFAEQVSDLYSADGSYSTDPWVPHAAHYGYAHAAHAHAAQAHAYHHNMAQYGSLLRLPQHYGHSSRCAPFWPFDGLAEN